MSSTAAEVQHHLRKLQAERAMVALEGLANDPAYMADLEDEIAQTRSAYVVAAVTGDRDVAAEISGPQLG